MMSKSTKFANKSASKLLGMILTTAVLAVGAAPIVHAAEDGHGSTSGHADEGQGKGKGPKYMGGKEGESHSTGHGGASKTTEGRVMGGKSGGDRITGKDLARLNASRVFLSTGITKTDAIYEDEAPLSKIYNYQQLLKNNPDLNNTALVSAAAFNLARVATVPVTADTLKKLDTILGTTFTSSYNWSTGGAAVESALELTAMSVLGRTVDIATPTSFTDAVNLLQKALKTEEE